MVKTGYISLITQSGGGQDGDGNPIAPTDTQTSFLECNLQVVNKELRYMVDGQFQVAKFSIYLDQCIIPQGIDLNAVKRVQIKDNNQNLIGGFQIINLEYLNITNRVKIVL